MEAINKTVITYNGEIYNYKDLNSLKIIGTLIVIPILNVFGML